MACSLGEGLLCIVFCRVHIHKVIFVNPILYEKVAKADKWNDWCNRAEKYTDCPDNCDKCKLVAWVKVHSVCELCWRQLHVCWLLRHHVLVDSCANPVWTIESIQSIAEKTEPCKEPCEKACSMQYFHFDRRCCCGC